MTTHHPLLAAMEEIERKLDALCAENTPERKESDMTDYVPSSDDEDMPDDARMLETTLDRLVAESDIRPRPDHVNLDGILFRKVLRLPQRWILVHTKEGPKINFMIIEWEETMRRIYNEAAHEDGEYTVEIHELNAINTPSRTVIHSLEELKAFIRAVPTQPQASAPSAEAQALEAELNRVANATAQYTWIERETKRVKYEGGMPDPVTLFGFPVRNATMGVSPMGPPRLWRIGFQQPPSANIIQLIIVLWDARWINTIKKIGKTDQPLFDGYARYNVGDYSVRVVGYGRAVIRTLADLEAIMQTKY